MDGFRSLARVSRVEMLSRAALSCHHFALIVYTPLVIRSSRTVSLKSRDSQLVLHPSPSNDKTELVLRCGSIR